MSNSWYPGVGGPATALNFAATPGLVQLSGSTVAQFYADRYVQLGAPTATANYGVLSAGGAAFDGTTAGHFAGHASGSVLALATATGFGGNLIDAQVNGVSKFKVDSAGNITATSISASITQSGLNLSTNPGNIQVTSTTVITLSTDHSVFSTAVAATANYGTVNIGSAPFDGSTTGHFVGGGSGTLLSFNAPTGYAGNIIDAQVNGVSKFKVDASGNLTAGTITGTLSISAINLTANPGILQVTGTTVLSLATDKVLVPTAVTATANYGSVSVGSGPFDGTTAGHFVGNASGTLVALNAPSGYAGILLDAQVNGVSKMKVDASGNITSGTISSGAITSSGAVTGSSLSTAGTITSGNITSGSAHNFSSGPGLLQVGGTTALSLATDKILVPTAPTGTANYGLVSLGSGPFDGSSAGKFVGNASGTVVAINAASGYSGNLVDYQVGGTSKFKVDASGNLTVGNITAGTITGTFSPTTLNFSANPGSLQVTSTTVQTLYTDRTVHATAVTTTANYGTVSIGSGAFDGSTAGHFAGNANGTVLALNAPTGYTGSLLDIQLAGSSKVLVDATGNLTVQNGGQFQGASLASVSNAGAYLQLSSNVVSVIQRVAGSVALVTKGAASQSGDLQQWQDSSSVVWARVSAPTYGTNNGVLSLGNGVWDGTSAGHYVGSASGTILAINAASGYAGNLVDSQVAGVSKFKVDASGNLTVAGALSQGNVNLNTNPGNVQVTGTTVITIGTDKTLFPTAVTATPNYARVGVGSAPWDGSTSGHFVGSANGTSLAINEPSGFTGNLVDFQVAGVSKASMLPTGEVVVPGVVTALATKTAAYTVTTSDTALLGDATTAAFTLTMMAANAVKAGRRFIFKKIDNSVNAVTVAATGTDKIDGAASLALAMRYQAVELMSDGSSNWVIIASYS